MNLLSSNLFRAAAVAFALPVLGMCAAVQINGVCVDGNCTTPNAVTYGNGEAGSTSTGVVVNTDPYHVNTSFIVSSGASAPTGAGTYILFEPIVSYVGSGASVGPVDTVTVDLFASITAAGAANWNGTYTEHVPLSVATGSTASGQLFAYTPTTAEQGIGLVGPYGVGLYDVSMSKSLVGLSGNTLDYDYQFIFSFDAGTAPGAKDSSTPEPAQMIPAALSLAGFALVALRRRKQ